MKFRLLLSGLALMAVATGPVRAAEPDPFAAMESLLTPQVLLGGVVQERDVSLFFDHLRASMLAAGEGRASPPLPDELDRRLEAAGAEMRLRGTLIGLALSQVMERALRESLRELSRPATRDSD